MTPAYALDVQTFAITRLATTGPSPGWIYRHRAALVEGGRAVRVSGGQVLRGRGKQETSGRGEDADLDLATLTWRPAPPLPPAHVPQNDELPDAWERVGTGQADYLLSSLRDEVPLGHPLFAVDVWPLAEGPQGQVLFRMSDGSNRVAVVSLAYADVHATLPEPRTTFYPDPGAWRTAAPPDPYGREGR